MDYTREQLISMLPRFDRYNREKQTKNVVDLLSDKNLLDLYELDKLDTTSGRRFYKNYLTHAKKQYSCYMREDIWEGEIDEDYMREIFETYYVSVLKDFIRIRPTYIYGRVTEGTQQVFTDRKVYHDILSYIQDLYMSFLKLSENKIVYDFIRNNDVKGLAEYFIDKYGDVKITLLEDIMKSIKNELRYINTIPFIAKSPVSIFAQENRFSAEYSRYIKETGLRVMYHDLNKVNSKKLKSIDAIKVIEEFVDSEEYDAVKYFYNDNYPDRNYHNDVELVKEFDPDLHVRYIEKTDTTHRSRYAILSATGRKLRDAIIKSKYKLSLLEFFKIYNPGTIANFLNYKNNVIKNLQPDVYTVLNSYLRKISFRQIETKEIMETKVTINDRVLTNEEKELILKYIKDNKLPFMFRLYNEIYREYIKGNLDLNKPFKEDIYNE